MRRPRPSWCAAWLLALPVAGCSVAPAPEDREGFLASSIAQSVWFERTVPGLRERARDAAAFIVFPDAIQWGTLMGGGQWARGAVFIPPRRHVGWVAVNGSSLGIQAGFAGYNMMIIVKDERTCRALKYDMIRPGMAVSGVVGPGGAARNPSMESGFEIVIADEAGLLVGVAAAVQWIRYEPAE
jgi:lipid-binding SYLF domain-containing protein